jgi:DNA-binding response OmpR family regulator
MNNIIMVVDDTKVLANLYCNFLKKSGYGSVAAYSSRECLSLLDEIVPDLILLDIMMEPVDGWETLLKIREDERFLDTAVIMMTAKSIIPGDIISYGYLIDGYVMKPVKPIELIDLIDIAGRRKKELSVLRTSAKNSGAEEREINRFMRNLKEYEVFLELRDLIFKIHYPLEGSGEFDEEFLAGMAQVNDMINERRSAINEFKSIYSGIE